MRFPWRTTFVTSVLKSAFVNIFAILILKVKDSYLQTQKQKKNWSWRLSRNQGCLFYFLDIEKWNVEALKDEMIHWLWCSYKYLSQTQSLQKKIFKVLRASHWNGVWYDFECYRDKQQIRCSGFLWATVWCEIVWFSLHIKPEFQPCSYQWKRARTQFLQYLSLHWRMACMKWSSQWNWETLYQMK